MATSFGALCTDFYVNQELALKMDMPSDRETLLHLFDRIRADFPAMEKLRRYPEELSLESRRDDGKYSWMALRRTGIRSGHVNPESLEQAYALHKCILGVAPYHLTISPLDVDYLELLFGFDLECPENHHEIVYEALIADTPLARLMDDREGVPCDVQPAYGMLVGENLDVQATFEVKCQTTASQIRRGQYRPEPISIYMSLRKRGPIRKPEDLLTIFEELRQHAERLANEKVVPELLIPISRAITPSA